jgi:8-oxo-dGTP diphosphatase
MVAKSIGAAAVIVDDDGKVLLVKHTYGRLNWELPGGGAEANESAAETAVREVREETGLQVSVERLTGVYYEPDFDMHHFVFICRRLDGSQTPRPDRVEIAECHYWPPDALPRPISDFTIRRIHDAMSKTTATSISMVPTRQWFD